MKHKWSLFAVTSTIAIGAVISTIPGCGDPCNTPEGKSSYDKGAKDGTNKTQDDAARGAVDGKAKALTLTHDQGVKDGYPVGYNDGYQVGYNSGNGYQKGYNDQYQAYKIQGAQDQTACASGDQDGYNAGLPKGQVDGVPVGEHDGYTDGQKDGYNAGFPAGVAACQNGHGSGSPSPQELQVCYQDGLSTTYQSGAYQAAYMQAYNANIPAQYTQGVEDGKNQGFNQGMTDGTNKGYADGSAKGAVDGYKDGQQVAYTNCYQNGTNRGYADGYKAGYAQGYQDPTLGYGNAPTQGSYSNGTGGYGDGYHDGYVDGGTSQGCQFAGTGGMLAQADRRFQGRDWRKVVNGLTIDTHVQVYSEALLTDDTREALMKIRDDRRAELHKAAQALEDKLALDNAKFE